ncbi:MAG: site-specific DNA-methyltransferase [Gammaproteobacteria bacterium]|nr:site-specific DNA-methyltransferase [Gammaproteobacteria bacterium]
MSMINPSEAKENNISVTHSQNRLGVNSSTILNKLRELMPNLVNSDGVVDIKALQDIVDFTNSSSNDQGYELTFAGKGLARAQFNIPSEFELKTEKEQSKYFDKTKNVIIRGDNIDALKILHQNYYGKIKLIYIDPPYNTKSDGFIYKDDFRHSDRVLIAESRLKEETINHLNNILGTKSHSGWLAFMYPRLKLARSLLREDGAIFISIDDNEYANLKIICDELFGEENLFCCLHVEMSTTQGMKVASALKGAIVKNAEYVLVYAKNQTNLFFNPLYEKREWDDHYNIWYDADSDIQSTLLKYLNNNRTNESGLSSKIKSSDIGKYYGRNEDFRKYIHKHAHHIWRDAMCNIRLELSKNEEIDLKSGKIVKYLNNDKLYFLKMTNTGVIRQLLKLNLAIGETDDFDKRYGLRKIRGDWWKDYYKDMMNINQEGGVIFKNGKKPIRLIRDIVKASTKNSDIILDFFAGSGTTGEAVMQLNAEDGGSRKFILVQSDEEINLNKNRESFDLCIDNNLPPVISSITLLRLNLAGENLISSERGGG